jgi:hypothetical protein
MCIYLPYLEFFFLHPSLNLEPSCHLSPSQGVRFLEPPTAASFGGPLDLDAALSYHDASPTAVSKRHHPLLLVALLFRFACCAPISTTSRVHRSCGCASVIDEGSKVVVPRLSTPVAMQQKRRARCARRCFIKG